MLRSTSPRPENGDDEATLTPNKLEQDAAVLKRLGVNVYLIRSTTNLCGLIGVFTFFFSLFVMDPPDSVVERGWMESGLEPALWGGLFVNLVLATAGGVLGLGIGVVLAFGRQSDLPIFKWPSTALIETVRAGPMIAWLYFAKYLLEDVIVPFSDADSIMRTLLMFAFFGGVYTAELSLIHI